MKIKQRAAIFNSQVILRPMVSLTRGSKLKRGLHQLESRGEKFKKCSEGVTHLIPLLLLFISLNWSRHCRFSLGCVERCNANVLKRLRRKQTKSGRPRFGKRPDLTEQSVITLPTILKTMNTPQWARHLFGRRNAAWLSIWLVRHNVSCCYCYIQKHFVNSDAFRYSFRAVLLTQSQKMVPHLCSFFFFFFFFLSSLKWHTSNGAQ